MNSGAHFSDLPCELFLTAGKNISICAALPRSSNGKTTDSDSVAERPESPTLRILDSICSPRRSAAFRGDCALSDPSLMKRCLNTHFRQSQTKAAFSIAGNLAVLRDGVLGNTAVLPRGEF